MKNVDGLPYFAYGSNLSVQGMAARCPAAAKIGRARLDGWRLTFRGVADIELAEGEAVEGALWLTTTRCVKSLDSYEGAPHLYDREVVEVVDPSGKKIKAFTYVMVSHLDVGLPSPYYYGIIQDGYRDFEIDVAGLEKSLDDLVERHTGKLISHYEPRGKKRLMAVFPEEDFDFSEVDDDPEDTYDGWSGMTPATRRLYEAERIHERNKGTDRRPVKIGTATVTLSREDRQAMRLGEYA